MKKKQKVLYDFIDLEPSAKADFTDNVVKEMGISAGKFTDPTPKLPELTTMAGNVREHYKGSLNGNHDEEVLLEDAIVKLDNGLRTEATYVDLVAQGDETIINLAGFKASKAETTPAQPPLKSTNFVGSPGTSRGVLILETEALEFATFYTFIIGKAISGVSFKGNAVVVNSATDVIILTSKRLKITLKNMESNATYQCMVFGTSSKAGKGANSEIITVTTF